MVREACMCARQCEQDDELREKIAMPMKEEKDHTQSHNMQNGFGTMISNVYVYTLLFGIFLVKKGVSKYLKNFLFTSLCFLDSAVRIFLETDR